MGKEVSYLSTPNEDNVSTAGYRLIKEGQLFRNSCFLDVRVANLPFSTQRPAVCRSVQRFEAGRLPTNCGDFFTATRIVS